MKGRNYQSLVSFISLILFVIIITICFLSIKNKNNEDYALRVEENFWSSERSTINEYSFDKVVKGDIISDTSFGLITVDSVSNDYIVLRFNEGNFVVREEGKGINLTADSLTTLQINRGTPISVSSQTMDAGVTVKVKFN